MIKYNIFLDTNVFGKKENYDFQKGVISKIISLICERDDVKVFIPDMVLEELKKHIKEFLNDDERKPKSNYLKKYVKKDFYISVYNKNCKEIEDFIQNNNIEIIKTSEYCNISDINNWYFNTILPFENKKEKKNEFPDAIIVSAIANYVNKEKIKNVYMVTEDKGVIESIERLVKFKINTLGDIKSIANEILGYNTDLLGKINNYFYEVISKNLNIINIYSDDDGDILNIYEIKAYNVDSQILEINDNYYEVLIEFNAKVEGEFCIINPYNSVYDREDPECSYIEYCYSERLDLQDQAIIVGLEIENENIIDYELCDNSETEIYNYLEEMEIIS